MTGEIMERVSPEEIALARDLDQKVRRIAGHMAQDFLALGDAVAEMEHTRRWTLLRDRDGEYYRSFEDWLRGAIPKSRSLAFAAKKAVTRLTGVPRFQLEQMTAQNMDLLGRLPEKKRTPEIIDAAIDLDYREFAAKVQEHAPEEHLEAKRRLIFNCELSRAQAIEDLLDWAAMELTEPGEPVMSREETLENVLVEYRQYRESPGLDEEE